MSILKLVLRIGVPAAMQMVIMSLAEALLSMVNGFGHVPPRPMASATRC
jgi:Na+-driven multidrug efflux pump